MFSLRIAIGTIVVLGLSCASYSQRGAAGYGQNAGGGGQGGFGGGMGGGMGGRMGGGMGGPGFYDRMQSANSNTNSRSNPDLQPAAPRPEDDSTQGLWSRKTAILTPGDRVEFKLKMHKGETLMASVTSDAFDPALELVDNAAKSLAKNDDRAEGDQSPFLSYRFSQDGDYLLKVLSFHSVAGGKFEIRMRTFTALDAGIGETKFDTAHPVYAQGQSRIVFRVAAKKGLIYDIRNLVDVQQNYEQFLSVFAMIGPSGVQANDYETIQSPNGGTVFAALADGDFYLECYAQPGKAFRSNIDEVHPSPITAKTVQVTDMKSGSLYVYEFPVEHNQIVRSTIGGANVAYTMSLFANPEAKANDQVVVSPTDWTFFQTKVNSDVDVARIFHVKATARVAIRYFGAGSEKVTFKNVDSLPEWGAETTIKNDLEIGETQLFVLKSHKSELMRVFAKATKFLIKMEIYNLDGNLENSLSNRSSLIASDDLYFPNEGTFVIRMLCEGDGGSGDYQMRRDLPAATPYALGKVESLKLDGTDFGLYSLNLEGGKRYQFMNTMGGGWLMVDLLDDDGQFITSQKISFEKVAVQYFVPPHSGHYRLWLRGGASHWKFNFSLHVPPTIEGAG